MEYRDPIPYKYYQNANGFGALFDGAIRGALLMRQLFIPNDTGVVNNIIVYMNLVA